MKLIKFEYIKIAPKLIKYNNPSQSQIQRKYENGFLKYLNTVKEIKDL